MIWYRWIALISLVICLVSLAWHIFRLIRYGNPVDFSAKRGNISASVKYSLTRAMSPARKESAFLHLPTYTAGILYHLGTFVAIPLFLAMLAEIRPGGVYSVAFSLFLVVSGVSGAAILVKRVLKKQLRYLSNPDDFISNLLVTAVHFLTAATLYSGRYEAAYFLTTGLLLLYLPVGKLKHAVYFFAARYHLGFFYGWRGVWPPSQKH